jgi:predicted nucleic acid-binding protein
MSRRIHLDANVILRFLRDDDPRQSPAAAKLFQKASDGTAELLVSAVTLSEVFYAFTSFYRLSQRDAAAKLLPLIRAGAITFEQEECMSDALERVIAANVDFGDAWLAASAASSNELVASFDRDLLRFKDIQMYDFETKP